MQESHQDSHPSRRAVLIGSLAAAAAAGGIVAPSAAQASEGDTPRSQVLAGMGLGASSYDPPVTSAASSVGLRSDTQFVPPLLPADQVLLALVSDRVEGTIVTSCTGALGEHDLTGTLQWVDGSTSSYAIDTVEGSRVNGHLVLHATGTIDSGHYTGAKVDRLETRLSNNLAACLGGEPITGTTGSVVMSITTA